MKRAAWMLVSSSLLLLAAPARAHHEALFGPQSSLAVESDGFVSMQAHEHVFGEGRSLDRETSFLVSGGVSPFRGVPWSLTLVQAFTYENARSAQGEQTGPFSACSGCVARENLLVSTSYRFDFASLQRATGKDGNFALLSVALEPPTGEKDYAPLHGPVNYMFAGMAGFEWGSFSAVALGYYRTNSIDGTGSKKGNNWLAGGGFAFTPIDEPARMVSLQLGLAAELHDRDVIDGAVLERSGGWEILASPTVVWMPAKHLRFFTYVSLPLAENYLWSDEKDQWRAGLGVIYSFDRKPEPPVEVPPRP